MQTKYTIQLLFNIFMLYNNLYNENFKLNFVDPHVCEKLL
jgi:hypothetical protein